MKINYKMSNYLRYKREKSKRDSFSCLLCFSGLYWVVTTCDKPLLINDIIFAVKKKRDSFLINTKLYKVATKKKMWILSKCEIKAIFTLLFFFILFTNIKSPRKKEKRENNYSFSQKKKKIILTTLL